jgi:hypothetical protein
MTNGVCCSFIAEIAPRWTLSASGTSPLDSPSLLIQGYGLAPPLSVPLSAPPEHEFFPATIWVGTGNPLIDQFKMRRETVPKFTHRHRPWRAVRSANDVVNRQKNAGRFQPAQESSSIIIPTLWI